MFSDNIISYFLGICIVLSNENKGYWSEINPSVTSIQVSALFNWNTRGKPKITTTINLHLELIPWIARRFVETPSYFPSVLSSGPFTPTMIALWTFPDILSPPFVPYRLCIDSRNVLRCFILLFLLFCLCCCSAPVSLFFLTLFRV